MPPRGRPPRGWKPGIDAVYVPPDAPDVSVGQNGRPLGSGKGPTRQTQQQGSAAAAAAARRDRAEEAEDRRASLQAEIGASWCMHIGSCPEGPVHPSQFSQQPDGEVIYFGLDCVFKLLLPRWACACCKQSFNPHALDLGCFPNTPSTAHFWYDLKVLQQYKQLGLGGGLSATGGWA